MGVTQFEIVIFIEVVAFEPSVYGKKPLYLLKVWKRPAYTLPSPDYIGFIVVVLVV